MCHPGLPAEVLAAATSGPRVPEADLVDVEVAGDEPAGASVDPPPVG
jgi:hypothetical protein